MRRDSIVSWSPWVASPFVRERGRVRDNLTLIEALAAHASPQSSPLEQGERRDKPDGIQTTTDEHHRTGGAMLHLSCHCRAKPYKMHPRKVRWASPPGAPPDPLPAGSTATRARVAQVKCNYENQKQN